jgi:hypothetical protein
LASAAGEDGNGSAPRVSKWVFVATVFSAMVSAKA